MPKPLRSDEHLHAARPQSTQFSHFGVLDDGTRSKGAAATSIVINVVIVILVIVIGMIAKTNPIVAKKLTALTLAPEPPKVAPKPPPPPPPPLKPLPSPPHVDPPKIIKLPEPVKIPELKPVEVPVPKPVVPAPAPPKAVTPPPAPVKVNLGQAMAAHIANNDAHPAAVALGANTAIKPTGPAVAAVNMSSGMAGMSGSANGPRATTVSMGSGAPNGSMGGRDNGAKVTGVRLGVTGGTGPLNSKNYSNAPVNVQLQTAMAPVATHPKVQSMAVASAPKVTYKPTPSYTAEAKSLHLEGNVAIKIKVLASGEVQVLGVVHGLGHGLDESAVSATQATRFRPALDASGQPVDWEGVVNVNFQMS